MIIDIDCPLCRGEGHVETGEMESGPAGIGFERTEVSLNAECAEGLMQS